MSIQAVGWVLEHSEATGSERLVMLALANHAGDRCSDGAWEAYPGVATIAREARLNHRVTQTVLRRLVAGGHLEVRLNAAPDTRIRGDRRPNLYRILTTPDGVRGGAPRDPDPDTHDGVHAHDTPSRSRGAVPARHGVQPQRATGCSPTAPEPSLNRQKNQPPSRDPRALPPPADPARGDETPESDTPPAVTADQRRTRIQQAATILARRFAERTPGIGRRDAWIGSVAERLAGQHATEGHRLLTEHPDLPPGALADLLHQPPGPDPAAAARARNAEAAEATRAANRAAAPDPAARKLSVEAARRLRDQLRRPA